MTTRQALRIARILWTFTVVLFIAAVIANLFGARLDWMRMSPQWRARADMVVLRGQWIARSIVLFVISAVCGVAGVLFSIKAADKDNGPSAR